MPPPVTIEDMDSSTWFNFATLVVALIALGISTAFNLRTLRIAQAANHLPVVSSVLAPHRDPAFLDREDYLNDHIGEHDPAAGFRGLPEPIRAYAVEVCQQYQLLGYLSRYGLADQRVLIAQTRYNAMRTWSAVEAHVRAERRLRGGESTFFNSFELFVNVASRLDADVEMVMPPTPSRSLRRRRSLRRNRGLYPED